MISQERLQELCSYDESGKLIRKVQTSNFIKIGDEVGNKTKSGYLECSMDTQRYYVHRLIFLYHHGYMPRLIDHINNDRSDNRIDNLRDASDGLNAFSKRRNKHNRSGKTGVSFVIKRKEWVASLNKDGKRVFHGYFKKFQDAVDARREAELEHYGEYSPA